MRRRRGGMHAVESLDRREGRLRLVAKDEELSLRFSFSLPSPPLAHVRWGRDQDRTSSSAPAIGRVRQIEGVVVRISFAEGQVARNTLVRRAVALPNRAGA